MSSRVITSETDRKNLLLWLGQVDLPCTVSVVKGKKRSVDQNRLQRLLLNEISEQSGHTKEEVRAYCKLAIGVPILKDEDDYFREKYDRLIQPHTAQERLEMMALPLDFPVTRLMTTKQMTAYIDEIYRHFTSKGMVLTVPEH